MADPSSAPPASVLVMMLIFFAASFRSAAAQANATDPVEVEALKAFGSRIGLSPPWTFDGVDPCLNGTDATGWGSIAGASNFQSSRGIECDCNISTATSFCHVTKLAIVDMRVTGQITPEIGNLSYLLDLNLQANLITGTIPEELGLLRRMTHMTVASNRLSGAIPRSIGNLANLLTLSFAVNNFSGPLPKEIGDLTSLTEIYLDSSGLGGELPQELANLKSLKTLNMFDNNFNGTIPVFLSNLSSLEALAIFGNQFNGPIPTSFANLQNLKSLEIGDIPSGGAIPPEFNRLQNLNKLSLRNCELSGSIPELGNLSKLEELDLSYNNLTGSIPASLSTIPLKRLFLGSNNLTGTLPAGLDSLTALDVSFNKLSGTVPLFNNVSTISNQFAVNQMEGDARICLQSMSNCGRKNVGFAINCGGKELIADGTTFSEDMASFGNGTGTYYKPGQAWAVTGSGFADSFKVAPQWFQSIGETTGEETTLYQDARTAPISLRYFGLGMKDGPYTIRLYFAEIVMGIGSDGPGLGRRFFDVYIQGERKLKDFSIRTEANGSLKAVVKTFKVNSSSGIIDIHLLWKGKGTCCAPFRSYGPLVSAIKVSHAVDGNNVNSSGSDSRRKKIGIGVGLGILGIVVLVSLLLWRRRARYGNLVDQDLKSLDGKLHIFHYNEIRTATRNFAEENLLGKGGFGAVYKGELRDGTIIAIKQLFAVKSHQSTREFVNEATLISTIQHRNLVKLLGCCVDGEHRILVLEFLENNSLFHALLSPAGPRFHLDWPTRFNICLGIARGLAYLHEELSPRIIHRDIKANNVLLDKTLTPKIADFGLAKLFDDTQSHISTRVAGTLGYLAPEYAMRGQLTEKADVYSFGILTLEIVSGRASIDTKSEDMVYLIDHAWHLYETDQVLELLDKKLDDFDEEQVIKVIRVALLCSQASPGSRPTMSKVVAMLSGSEAVDVSSLKPGQFTAVEFAAKFPQIKTRQIKDGDSSSHGPGTDSPWRGSSSKSIEPR